MHAIFYSTGLYFSCLRCSQCCRGEPGYVFLNFTDIMHLMQHVSRDFLSFRNSYCRWVLLNSGWMLSLQESASYDCVFWTNQNSSTGSFSGCRIYKIRPLQCQNYPFWSSNISSSYSWALASSSCPGIGKGKFWSKDEIDNILKHSDAHSPIVVDSNIQHKSLDSYFIQNYLRALPATPAT